jgi:hypothetical protein
LTSTFLFDWCAACSAFTFTEYAAQAALFALAQPAQNADCRKMFVRFEVKILVRQY